MQKRWLVLTAAILVACSIFTFIATRPPKPPFDLPFTLVAESDFDPSHAYESLGLVVGSEYTAYEYIRGTGFDHLEQLAEEHHFEFPTDLDHSRYTYIVAYGRQIAAMEAVGTNGSNYILSVTFEESHRGNMVFLYQLDKILIYPFSWDIYIMDDENKIFWGDDISDINELDPENLIHNGK